MVVKGLLDSGELLLRRSPAELTRKGVGICHLCSNDRALRSSPSVYNISSTDIEDVRLPSKSFVRYLS